MNDSIPVSKFTLCWTTDMVNFLVDKFPLGQLSFHSSSFCECPLNFSFLGVFLGGMGAGAGLRSCHSVCGSRWSRAPLSGAGMALTPVLCTILDYRWSWQEEPPSLRQGNKLELLLPLNATKEFLTRKRTGWLNSPFSDPAWVFRAENEHSSHNQSSAASWHCSPSKLKSMLNAQPGPEVKM